MVRINQTILFAWFDGIAGSHMPIAVSHGEGRIEFKHNSQLQNFTCTKFSCSSVCGL